MKTKPLGILTGVTVCILIGSFCVFRLLAANNAPSSPPSISTPRPSRPDGAGKDPASLRMVSTDKIYRDEYLKSYSYRKFAPLLIKLSATLPTEVIACLRQTLAEREIAFADAKTEAFELKVDLQVYLGKQTELIRTRLTAKFGDQLTQAVESYIKTLPFRKALNEINLIMIYRGEGMSSIEMEQLCEVMAQIDTPSRSRVPTAEAIEAYVRTMEATYEKVQLAAAGFMSPKQLEVLRDELRMEISNMKSQRSDILAMAGRTK